jgi:hypothetical protein
VDALNYGYSRESAPIYVELWVAVSGVIAVASGPFFGAAPVDFIHTPQLSQWRQFLALSFDFLTFPALCR